MTERQQLCNNLLENKRVLFIYRLKIIDIQYKTLCCRVSFNQQHKTEQCVPLHFTIITTYVLQLISRNKRLRIGGITVPWSRKKRLRMGGIIQ